jgi:cytochrome d ubiquinol oxidase subunit II
MAAVIFSMGYGAFPFILFSATHPSHSLTVWDASSSRRTLIIMLLAAALFVPLMVAAARWVYRVLRGPVTVEDVNKNKDHWY